eukprot:330395-Hanusia_phi.AAC.2
MSELEVGTLVDLSTEEAVFIVLGSTRKPYKTPVISFWFTSLSNLQHDSMPHVQQEKGVQTHCASSKDVRLDIRQSGRVCLAACRFAL